MPEDPGPNGHQNDFLTLKKMKSVNTLTVIIGNRNGTMGLVGLRMVIISLSTSSQRLYCLPTQCSANSKISSIFESFLEHDLRSIKPDKATGSEDAVVTRAAPARSGQCGAGPTQNAD